MENVFLQFCGLASQALNRAWPGEKELKISNMYLIKFLFFTEEEMEDDMGNDRMEKRIYKWLQVNPEKSGTNRRPMEKDWLDIAVNIDKLTAPGNIEVFKQLLYETIQRIDKSVSFMDFICKINIEKFKSELGKSLEKAVGEGLIDQNRTVHLDAG